MLRQVGFYLTQHLFTTMKTLPFYLLIFTPLLAIVLLVKFELITPVAFVVSLGIYIILYYPGIIGLRLLGKHIITRREFGKVYIPLWYIKHFNDLFFN